MRVPIFRRVVVLSCWTFLASMVWAGGTEFTPRFGARSLALDGMLFADPKGLTAVITNPAGLLSLGGRGAQLSVIDRLEEQSYDSPRMGRFRSFRENDFSLGAGGWWQFSPRLTAAIAIYRAADYQVEWPFAMLRTRGANSLVLAFDLFHRLQADALTSSLGLQVLDTKWGAAVHLYRVHQHLALPIANDEWLLGRGAAGYQVEYRLKGWASALAFGGIVPINNRVRLGAMFHTGCQVDLSGKANSQIAAELDSTTAEVDASGQFKLPPSVGMGVVYELSEQLQVNGDIAYYFWATLPPRMDFALADAHWQSRLAKVDTATGFCASSFPLAMNNCLEVGFGCEYSPRGSMTYRLGYRFSQSPNSSLSYSFLFPRNAQHWLSVGLAYKEGAYRLELTVAYGSGVSTTVSATENLRFHGQFNSNIIVPAVSLQYLFQ